MFLHCGCKSVGYTGEYNSALTKWNIIGKQIFVCVGNRQDCSVFLLTGQSVIWSQVWGFCEPEVGETRLDVGRFTVLESNKGEKETVLCCSSASLLSLKPIKVKKIAPSWKNMEPFLPSTYIERTGSWDENKRTRGNSSAPHKWIINQKLVTRACSRGWRLILIFFRKCPAAEQIFFWKL